jgi:hypothetical protein
VPPWGSGEPLESQRAGECVRPVGVTAKQPLDDTAATRR